jgi:hypothetical protein
MVKEVVGRRLQPLHADHAEAWNFWAEATDRDTGEQKSNFNGADP